MLCLWCRRGRWEGAIPPVAWPGQRRQRGDGGGGGGLLLPLPPPTEPGRGPGRVGWRGRAVGRVPADPTGQSKSGNCCNSLMSELDIYAKKPRKGLLKPIKNSLRILIASWQLSQHRRTHLRIAERFHFNGKSVEFTRRCHESRSPDQKSPRMFAWRQK